MSTLSDTHLNKIIEDTVAADMRGDKQAVKITMRPIFTGDGEDVYNGLSRLMIMMAMLLPKPEPGTRVEMGFVPRDPRTGELGDPPLDADGHPIIPEQQVGTVEHMFMRMLVAVITEEAHEFALLFHEAYMSEDITTIPRLFIVAIKTASSMFRSQIAKFN